MAWGPGHFENDRAVDWLYSGIHTPLLEKIRGGVTHADERAGNEVMAAAEVLAIVCEQIRRNYLHPDQVTAWRDTFLRSWEHYADRINGPPGFKEARRAEIVRTFGRLLVVAEWLREQAVARAAVGPVKLTVVSEEFISREERERLQARIGEAIQVAGGSVLGGESTEEPDERGNRCRIVVVVPDHEAGVRILRRALRAADLPAATWIHQSEPDEAYYEIWIDEDHPPLWG
jgi:hypothetical protein